MSKQQVQAMQQIGTKLIPLRSGVQTCEIFKPAKPPNLITVKYESGKLKAWSQTHLLKYYMLDLRQNNENKI